MRGLLTALYSAVVYVFFLATFVYAILFVEGVIVPKTIDSGAPGDLVTSVVINLALLGLFAVQHTVMARPGFKRAWTKIVPPAAERSTFVLAASVALALICWQWRPLPETVWHVDDTVMATAITALSWGGWGLLLLSTFLISHFHLFGLTQGWARILGIPEKTGGAFVTPLFYKWIRHPLYTGFIIAFWAAPHMSVGHLLFAAACTGYILIGIWFEERDLVAEFGTRYVEYRRHAGMLFPKIRLGGSREASVRR